MSNKPMTTTARQSLWADGVALTDYPPVGVSTTKTVYDVVVVGGGLSGLTTALLLKREGLQVAVVEADRIGYGVSGNNTAKVTALQATAYSTIARTHGAKAAAGYAEASLAGVELVASLAAEEGIDCDLERRPAYTYAHTEDEQGAVRAEADAAERAGLGVVRDIPPDLPYPVAASVRLDDQVRLHPLRYAQGLAAAVQGGGCQVFERSRVRQVDEGDPCVVRTDRGVVRGAKVVVATHYPILDRGLYFARLEPTRSYCLALRLRDGAPPAALAISAGKKAWSISSAGEFLIVGGEGHPVGERADSSEHFRVLESFAREHWDVAEVTHRWSAQDPVPFDRLPMVGSYRPGSHRLYVATGYAKWGLSTASFAALLLTDLIAGRRSPWADLVSPHRLSPRGLPRLARMNAKVGADLVADHLVPTKTVAPEELAPGQACVRRDGVGKTGVYRDEEGRLHAVSLRCTHLGCLVRFNEAEHSWDCPCHGSRFDVDGAVLEGPATRPLGRREP